MSKSGSRYGRRSNWFKIHCLLQEQQNKANNNSISQNGNNINSNNNSPNPTQHHPGLPNDFISSHFLANLYNNYSNNNNNNNGSTKSQEIKRVSSPSDSGASSADPEENSLKFHNNNNLVTKSKNLNLLKPRSNSFSEKIEKANSSSNDGYISPVIGRKINNLNNSSMKPMSPFLPFSLHHSLSSSALSSRTPSTPEYFMLPLPQISLTPSPLQKLTFSDEQHEPIDLSVKSNKRLRDYSLDETETDAKSIRSSTPLSSMPVHEIPKTVPLDLTLVRSG
jgi:nuclear receptor subfamily 0 group A